MGNELDASAVRANKWGSSRFSGLLQWLKFLLALGSVGGALYFVIGSFLFPQWFFPLFWQGKFWSLSYWTAGVYWLLDNVPYWVVAIIVLAAACSFAYVLLRTKVQPFIDRSWRWIVACCVFSVVVTCLLVYKFEHGLFEAADAANVMLNQLDAILQTIGAPPPIDPLTDFHYLNTDRVAALYGELQPELIEQQRRVTASSSSSAKAGIASGPASAELNSGRDSASESTLARTQFSPERKCIEIIKNILENHPERYYSNLERSALFKATQQSKDAMEKARSEPTNPANLEAFRLLSQEVLEQRKIQLNSEVEHDLGGLAGVIIVDGDFLVARQGRVLLLTETYSEKPRIYFETTAPDGDGFRGLESNHKTRLRVLGTIMTPLGADGKIEFRTLAVY